MLRGRWIVADMDGTLTSTPGRAGGRYLSLSECPPCKEPLNKWLRLGGNLCVVSTAGRRMWRQIYDEVKPTLQEAPNVGKFAICGFSGAALFKSDPLKEHVMVEDVDYRFKAAEGGTSIPVAAQNPVEDLCAEVVFAFLKAAQKQRSLIKMLSTKYHSPYTLLVDSLDEMGEEKFRTDVLTKSRMMTHGEFFKETHDAILDCQTLPGTEERVVVQYSVMGIPMAVFDDFFTPDIIAKFSAHGLYAKKQPNSVVVAKTGVDKATCVRWLVGNGEQYEFKLHESIAFGDFPQSVDKPLTIHPPMQFVSCSSDPSQDPQGVLSVGFEEAGTAAFLDVLMDSCEKSKSVPEFDVDVLSAIAESAKAKVLAETATRNSKV